MFNIKSQVKIGLNLLYYTNLYTSLHKQLPISDNFKRNVPYCTDSNHDIHFIAFSYGDSFNKPNTI